MSRPSPVTILASFVVTLWGGGAWAAGDGEVPRALEAAAAPIRAERPFAVQGVVGFPIGVGARVLWNPWPRLTLSGEITTFVVAGSIERVGLAVNLLAGPITPYAYGTAAISQGTESTRGWGYSVGLGVEAASARGMVFSAELGYFETRLAIGYRF